MVGGNPPIMWVFLKMTNIGYPTNQLTNGMCGKIKIKKAYFCERHVDLVWYGRNEI
jgi:hypothetical protein